jgi:hypothetical protein
MMLLRFGLTSAAALSFVLFAGCGADPTTGTAFAPPAGWTQTPGILGLKMWIDPTKGSNQVVMLVKLPNKSKIDIQKDVDLSSNPAFHGGSVTKQSKIMICGNHPADYLLAHDDGKNGKDAGDAEIILTNWGQDAYMAMYARSNGGKLNPEAEAAIRTICVKT